MNGISDSVRIDIDVAACEQCGLTSRIGRGLCLNCLMQHGFSGIESKTSLAAVLDEIDVKDADWRIGNYQILEEIGRGGMGVIYRARQRHSRRIVALKRILSYQADSRETLARFRREAEAAASLDHPNILPIYEVSECEEGLPFFSMKFAAGGSLLDAAPSLHKEPRRCVALMAKVAHAVYYAHTHGVLHRDLKPGNILLDACGEPLVSDFGLAKWLDTATDLTRTLTIFGTPGYIAPEQAKRSASKLTPAADVYSLGAILFDLFTGRPPFLGEHALAVIQQAAEKPAPKLRSLAPRRGRDLETICAKCLEREPRARYQSAAALADDLERWLEGKPIKARWALPPARAWRWSRRNPKLVTTAAACLFLGAASIWLLHQPGIARRISTAVKAVLSPQQVAEQSKLRQALMDYPDADVEVQYSHLGWERASQASLQERLYSGLAVRVTLDQKSLRDKLPKFALEVKRDRDAPLYEQASAAYLSKDYAESERLSLKAADEAQKVRTGRTTDIINALNLAAWSACKSSDCDRAIDHLREAENLTDKQRDPKKWADVQCTIGNVLLGLFRTPEAEKTFRDVIKVRTHACGPEDRQTLFARRRRAFALLELQKYAEAEADYRDLLKIDEKLFGAEHPETLRSRWDLAEAISGDYAGKLEEALLQFRELLKLREKVLGPEHPDTLRTRGALSNSLANLGLYTEAIAEKRKLLALQRKALGPEDNGTILSVVNLGIELAETGQFGEAEAMLRDAVRVREKTLGPTHHSTIDSRQELAKVLTLEGRYIEAEQEARNIIRIKDTTVGVERAGWTRDLLGMILDKQGRHEEAEVQIREALRMNEKSYGVEHSVTLASRGNLARNLWYQGKNVEAEAILRQSIALNEKVLGSATYARSNNNISRLDNEITPLSSRTLLANTLRDQQKDAEAEAEYKQAMQFEENALGPEQRDTLNACYNYAYQLAQQGRRDEAKALTERAVKGATKVLGTDDPNTREYVKFLEILKNGQPITIPYMKFHETFAFGKQT
jgi:tetratricopeptide (TPR) repeat protein/tRNA A-37 threonylcarbamoyl transferase component Bud32